MTVLSAPYAGQRGMGKTPVLHHLACENLLLCGIIGLFLCP